MSIWLYGQRLPYGPAPKFLEVKFDWRVNFCNEITNIEEKVLDRINLIKILSYNAQWRLPEKIRYKILIRSTIEYSSFKMICLNKDMKTLESILHNALTIILKIRLIDEVRCAE